MEPLAGVVPIQENLPRPLVGIAGLLLAPLFALGSLSSSGVRAPGLEAGRHAGAAGYIGWTLWLLALGIGLLVTA